MKGRGRGRETLKILYVAFTDWNKNEWIGEWESKDVGVRKNKSEDAGRKRSGYTGGGCCCSCIGGGFYTHDQATMGLFRACFQDFRL